MKEALDFQSIILNLQDFWSKQGCLIWQPYYSQVGAGTYNPATYLRVLGPEPWNVGYVEPSVRPDDGRYGENPNRLQQHTQFQVILKPDPGNPQEIYLNSLQALGIDPRRHDIRFVEDNWESPALGAWGLGWEVWLDGQEITQYTYFQQAGGIMLDPVSVEITYGLERIAMTLQHVRHFCDIRWNGDRTYGDVHLQGEQEHSKYYFEIAEVERLRKMYELFREEAQTCLSNGLVLPAHDYILKCSHTFNILDTRGAIGVTERQTIFGQMRELSRRVAEAYLAQRQHLEFPWLKETAKSQTKAAAGAAAGPTRSGSQPFLFEIGTEELPVADLKSAHAQLQTRLPVLFDELRLEHGEIRISSTPRRLVAAVEGLALRQPDRQTVVKGPPADRAFDALGNPTKAGEGFARSKGLTVSDLIVREMDGGKYACAAVSEVGQPALAVLSQALPGLIASIRFDKPMRWNSSNAAFSRPIRWLLALLGSEVVPFEYAGLQSGRITRGLRFLEPAEISVDVPEAYFKALAGQGIILDPQERREVIRQQVQELVQAVGGKSDLPAGLLDEVTDLVEAPTALRGEFEPDHLRLPKEVLISVMMKHQRYFPVEKSDGSLLPYFVAVRNGDDRHLDQVADGNAQVIRARFSDAAFFIEEDVKHRLEEFLPRLSTLTFQLKLGSMLDKTQRIERLVDLLAAQYKLGDLDAKTARRAARLCKADLVSHMVIEMTSLQGIIGSHYAWLSGEDELVARAIFEHYLPRNAGDTEPKTPAGLWVGLADRLDSLVGLFAAGLAPTGTKDPFALRRAAQGLVQNLCAHDLDFDLRKGLALAAEGLPLACGQDVQDACLEFVKGRMRSYLIEQQNFRYDLVDGVLAVQNYNPAGAARAVKELSVRVAEADWNTILPAYARCVRITRDQTEIFRVDPALFDEVEERALYEALQKAEKMDRQPGSVEDFMSAFLPMIPVINRFFEVVLVMAEDPARRSNRLGLLQRIAGLAAGVADFSKLEGF